MPKYYQGYFRPKNPEKYAGDPTQIVYRSRWEQVAMSRLDNNPSVISWSSEETVIPYLSPIDNKVHRYFVDLKVKQKVGDKIVTTLIEIKPFSQTQPPLLKEGKKPTKRHLEEILEYGKNQSKWKAAKAYCAKRGWNFQVITEKELGLKF